MSSTAILAIITLYTASQEDTVVHSALVKLLLYNLCVLYCMKSVPIQSFSGPIVGKYGPKIYEYGDFPRSVVLCFSLSRIKNQELKTPNFTPGIFFCLVFTATSIPIQKSKTKLETSFQ